MAGGIPRLLACDTIRLARGFQQRFREKVRPARSVPRLFREKLRPARHKPPIVGHFSCAGRTFSRTDSCDMATLKPMTPLRPLMQTNVKPPSPMLTPEQRPMKPPSPLQPKNAPKTPISHPQRRWRFQLRLSLREQRRHRFHTRDFQCTRAMAEPGRATHSNKPRRCGGHRRDLPRCRWAVAGPGRASRRRAERSSRRGRLAGGPPPTGTHSGRAHQDRPRGARNTSGATSNNSRRGQATRRPEIRRASSNAGNQAISGSQAPSGLPTWQQHPSARAGAPNRRQPARGPRPRQ